jgi:His-Xaa-Ser system protein HxsD
MSSWPKDRPGPCGSIGDVVNTPQRYAFTFRDGSINAVIDLRLYRLAAVQKAAYRCADRFTAVLETQQDHILQVSLVFRPGTSESEALEGARFFYEELLDQELREQIGEETQAIRALIIAQAFSRTDLVKRD